MLLRAYQTIIRPKDMLIKTVEDFITECAAVWENDHYTLERIVDEIEATMKMYQAQYNNLNIMSYVDGKLVTQRDELEKDLFNNADNVRQVKEILANHLDFSKSFLKHTQLKAI